MTEGAIPVPRAARRPARIPTRIPARLPAGLGRLLGRLDRGLAVGWLVSLAAGFALATFLVLAGWVAFGELRVGPPRELELVIERGTFEAVRAGNAGAIPSGLALVEGDTLVIRNEDVVTHTLGAWTVPAGGQLTVDAERPTASTLACSIHPSGAFGFTVRARPGIGEGVLVTSLLGLPLGLVLAGATTIIRRLGDDEDLEDPA